MAGTMTKRTRATGLPLKNVVVVELGHSVAAPYAGQILGDLGAKVIKIEKAGEGDDARVWGPPFIGATSACFWSLNRNKYSVAADLRDEMQVKRLREFMIEEADVVFQNLRPGSVAKLGLSAADLRNRNDKLIYCNLGAFGRRGPLSNRPAYDPLMQAYSGIMSVTGEEGRPPVRVGVSIVDMAAGMWAVIGILSALHQRALTGRGCEVDVSLFESALAWMTVHIANFTASGELPVRLGSGAVITAPYQAFQTQRGYIVIAAGNASLFKKMSIALNHAEWNDDVRFRTNSGRLKNKAALVALIESELRKHPPPFWMKRLERAGVPCAPIQDVKQVIAAKQTQALDILQKVGGGLQLVGLPISFDGVRPGLRMPAAKLGQHNSKLFKA
jgi:crotonobetainyl-CoA:carnitine CoA-transferase CaiB-like acyl-CoA transferase